MSIQFAPNNNVIGKRLYTGRTKDLDEIFNYLLAGQCVALFGERRGGKTLTLETIQAIINGDIKTYEKELVDQTLRAALPGWQAKLAKYLSVFVSLQGTRRDNELLARLLEQCQKVGLLPSASSPPAATSGGGSAVQPPASTQPPKNVEELLKLVQSKLKQIDRSLVILMDEMELLGEYSKSSGGALAELFGDRVNYPDIYFVHAGSYQWRERVQSPGSNFTHLEAKYLSQIFRDDLINFLLHPLNDDAIKHLIATLTGGKPLYAQYLGKAAADNRPLTEEDLLENDAYTSFREQINNNIYRERGLDEESKNILATLAYHPHVSRKWLARRLRLNEMEVAYRLKKLVEFGTLYRSQNNVGRAVAWVKRRLGGGQVVDAAIFGDRYAIVGKFIERYGRERFDNPARSPSPLYFRSLRWAGALVMLALAIFLYFYTHPDLERKRFPLQNGVVELEIPRSLEDDEQGALQVSFRNQGPQTVDSLQLVFDSEYIAYNRSGSHAVPFEKVEAGNTKIETISYRVMPGPQEKMDSKFFAPDQIAHSFEVSKRMFPLKKYILILGTLSALIGLLLPWKDWTTLLGAFKQLVGGSSETQPKEE